MKKLFVAVTIACLGIILVSVSVRAGDLVFERSGNLFEARYNEIVKFTPDGTKSTFATGLKNARNLIFDSKGNLFVSDEDSQSIFKFAPDGNKSTFATGIDALDMVIDRSGNLFVSDEKSKSIFRFTPDGKKSTFATGLEPFDIAFDKAGNLFVAASTSHAIFKFAPDGTRSTFASVFTHGVNSLALDRSGNLCVADSSSHAIFKFAPDGAKSTFATGIYGVKGLVFDPLGNLLVSVAPNDGSHAILKFTPDGKQSTFASGFRNSFELALDGAGNLFVSDGSSIFKFAPDGTKSSFALDVNISPDKKWECQEPDEDDLGPKIVKAGTNEVALDLSDECRGSVDWSPDSKRFALTCRQRGRSNGGTSLYQLRGGEWKPLRSPDDAVLEILNKAIAAQVKKSGLPRKTDLRLIWETLEVRRWVDSNTAILYAGLHQAVRENLERRFDVDFVFTLKFDDAGSWKIVKSHQMSDKEVEKREKGE